MKKQFGEKNYYTAEELEIAISPLRLSKKQRQHAYAMFTDEATCNQYLQRVGAKQEAKDIRVRMGTSMFGSFSAVSYDSSWNRFHDYNNEILGGIQSVGTTFTGAGNGGYESEGGFDGGFDGGGDFGGGE